MPVILNSPSPLTANDALSLPKRIAGQIRMNLVVRSEGGAVNLVVYEIGDVPEVFADCS